MTPPVPSPKAGPSSLASGVGVLARKTSVENGAAAPPADAGRQKPARAEAVAPGPAAPVASAAVLDAALDLLARSNQPKVVASKGARVQKIMKGTSRYKGVAQHRVTRRWESHVWENKKQIYLGSFATEKQAAQAYDKAAIFLNKCSDTLNFPYADYAGEADALRGMTREKLLAHLRRGSNGFSRGKTRFRGVSYRSHTGRWEARISGIEENKYTYLGTYDRPEEAAVAYDR